MSSSEESAVEEGGTTEHDSSSRETSEEHEEQEDVLESSDEVNKKPKKHKKQKLTNKYIDVAVHNAKLKNKKLIKHNKKITCRTVKDSTKPYIKNENTISERSSIVKRTVTFPKLTYRGQILLKQEGLNLRILDIYNGHCEVISKSSKELVVATEL